MIPSYCSGHVNLGFAFVSVMFHRDLLVLEVLGDFFIGESVGFVPGESRKTVKGNRATQLGVVVSPTYEEPKGVLDLRNAATITIHMVFSLLIRMGHQFVCVTG